MSRCFYLKTEYCVDFIGMQETLQMIMLHEYIVSYKEIDPSDGGRDSACFYIEGESACGVQVINKEGYIIIKLDSNCNYIDYYLASQILRIENDFLKTPVFDEDDNIIKPREYFSDENIQKLLDEDAL